MPLHEGTLAVYVTDPVQQRIAVPHAAVCSDHAEMPERSHERSVSGSGEQASLSHLASFLAPQLLHL